MLVIYQESLHDARSTKCKKKIVWNNCWRSKYAYHYMFVILLSSDKEYSENQKLLELLDSENHSLTTRNMKQNTFNQELRWTSLCYMSENCSAFIFPNSDLGYEYSF